MPEHTFCYQSPLLGAYCRMSTHNTLFSKPASEVISRRTSWRSCTGEALDTDQRKRLDAFINEQSEGIFGDKLRFSLVAAEKGDSESLRGLGTYGFIRGASAFIIGAIDRDTDNLEDYGLRLQEIVLKATDLDLATCWLGGTFYRDRFSERIQTQEHELVPAVVSVGIPAEKRNMVDHVIRRVAGSRKRKAWEELFFHAESMTPLTPEGSGEYTRVLEMLRMAPSASNKQPWRLILSDNKVEFFLERTRGYRKPFFADLQRIDMGIAMCHFEQICEEVGLQGRWQKSPAIPHHREDWEYILTWVRSH